MQPRVENSTTLRWSDKTTKGDSSHKGTYILGSEGCQALVAKVAFWSHNVAWDAKRYVQTDSVIPKQTPRWG